jgi:hypothetical protein
MTFNKLLRLLPLLAAALLSPPGHAEKVPAATNFDSDDATCVLGRCYSNPEQAPGDEWQLPAGNYQEATTPLAVWYPQGDSGPAAYAYHKRLPSTYTRKIPLGIVGGCPPYHVTINSGFTGMTVENDYDSADRWVLTVTNPTVESVTVDIDVEDQCGTTVNRTWAGEVISRDNATYFVYIDGGAAGGGDGSRTSPYNELGDIVGPNISDTTWQGRQVLCLGGTLTIAGQSASYATNNTKLRLNANKPRVWVSTTIGGCTLQGSAGNSLGANMNPSDGGTDFSIIGFNWQNPFMDESGGGGTQERNNYIHGSSGAYQYGVIAFNSFDGTSVAADEGSNSAAIHYALGASCADWGAVIGNTFDDFDHFMPMLFFSACHQVIQSNTVTNSSNTEGLGYIKGGADQNDYWFAFNVGTGNSGPISTIDCINSGPPWTRERIEFMHNRWVTSGSLPSGYALHLKGSAGGCVLGVESRRNSWKANHHRAQGSSVATGLFLFDWDSFEHDGTQTSPAAGVDDDGAGVTITVGANNDMGTSGIVDDTTGLQEGGADCTHGAEICAD